MFTHQKPGVTVAVSGLAETDAGYQRRLAFIAAAIEEHAAGGIPAARILDVGCGTGNFLAAPLARMGYALTAIDIHEETIRYAREEHSALPRLRFECTPVEDVSDHAYDVVICSEVLEHVDDPRAFLRQLQRVMRLDGTLIVTVPNGYGPFEAQSWVWRHLVEPSAPFKLARRLRARRRSDASGAAFLNRDSGHVNFFTMRALQDLAASVDMEMRGYRGRTFVCGPLFAPLFLVPGTTWLNARLADHLPSWAVSDWMFLLRNGAGERP